MVDGLARTLVKMGHDVELFALEGSTCPVPTHYIQRGNQPWPFSPVCHETGFIINAFEQLGAYDVVHDNSIVGAMYARAYPDQTFVTTNHGPFVGDLQTLYNHVAPWCTIVAVSNNQARGAEVPVDVIHHGVDTEMYSFGEGNGDERGEYLLFLGKIQDTKGPHLAAQAARAAGMRLLIAAKRDEGFEMDFFAKHVEPLLNDDVQFVGEVGGQEKIDLLGNAKALINPVIWPEPFGLVMAESLSCGTPVITLSNGAAPEIVENGVTGLVCHSELDLVDACRNIGEISRDVCRKSATSYFSLERMAEDYVKVYEKAIARKAAGKRSSVIDLTESTESEALTTN